MAVYMSCIMSKMWVKKYDLKSETFVSINPKYAHLVYSQEDVHLVGRVLITFTNL